MEMVTVEDAKIGAGEPLAVRDDLGGREFRTWMQSNSEVMAVSA